VYYDVEGWAYHHRAVALSKRAPPAFEVSLAKIRTPDGRDDFGAAMGDEPPDLIFAIAPERALVLREHLRRREWPTRLVSGWNVGWPNDQSLFRDVHALVDGVIVNSFEYWDRAGRLPRTYMLPNGVDLEIFRPRVAPEARLHKVLWTGSELFRARKNYDRLLVPLARALSAEGIDWEFELVDSFGGGCRTQWEMAAWYNTAKVYVCASEAEGTPNPALEAAACGCTVVSTPVGNMPQLLRDGINGHLVEASHDHLLRGVQRALANYRALSRAMLADIQAWSWRRRRREYFDVFSRILASTASQPGS
jgi:glycosyltransferase involved in cell wall biosynthesis